MLTFATLYGTRRVGRPPITRLKNIEEDLRNIRVGIWKRVAVGRDKWRTSLGRSRLEIGSRTTTIRLSLNHFLWNKKCQKMPGPRAMPGPLQTVAWPSAVSEPY
jgi:hypothetical protein